MSEVETVELAGGEYLTLNDNEKEMARSIGYVPMVADRKSIDAAFNYAETFYGGEAGNMIPLFVLYNTYTVAMVKMLSGIAGKVGVTEEEIFEAARSMMAGAEEAA